MHPLVVIIDQVIGLYAFTVLVYVVIQLLGHFKVLDVNSSIVIKVQGFLAKLVEPALSKIRIYVKPFDGIDFSPLVLLILLHFIRYSLVYYTT
jgi:YggT family protein